MNQSQEPRLGRLKATFAGFGQEEKRPRPEDGQLLQALAFLTERQPHNVLRLAAWKAGDDGVLESYRQGHPLPRRTRGELDAMLEERLQIERRTGARCESAAAGMVEIFFDFLALAAVLLLLLG